MTIFRTNIKAKNPQHQAFLDLVLLLMCGLVGALIGAIITKVVLDLAGIDNLKATIAALPPDAPASERNLIRSILMIGHLFLFWFASLSFAILLYKRQFTTFLQLNTSPSFIHLGYSGLIVFMSIPVVFLTYWLNQQIPLPDLLLNYESDAETLTQQLLIMNSPFELLFNLVVIALVPAVGEELIFRGVIQNIVSRWVKSEHLGAWVAGLLFSLMHMQFQGFLPRLFLGVLLGYFLIWTKNLWIPIFTHFIFNGSQVVAQYFAKVNIEQQEPDIEKLLPFSLFSLIIVVVLCVLMYKHSINQKVKS